MYDIARAKVAGLTSSLTPDHPDVVSAKRELDATSGRLQSARNRAAANDLEQRRMTGAIQRAEKRGENLRNQLEQLDKLIAGTPVVTAQLSELARDIDLLNAKVVSLISKKAERRSPRIWRPGRARRSSACWRARSRPASRPTRIGRNC